MSLFRQIINPFSLVMIVGMAVAVMVSVPAQAQKKKKDASNSGELYCDIAKGVSFIVGSKRKLACTYVPDQGRRERYTGHIKNFGIDIGPVKKGKIFWTVIAPGSGKKGPGRLAGTYVGYGGQVAVIKGGGYQNFLGGPNFNLIPTSVTGLTGVNVAVGVRSMKLVYVGR